MASRRSDSDMLKAALAHVITIVLGYPETSSVSIALQTAGIISIVDLAGLSESDISDLTYHVVTGTNEPVPTKLSIAERSKLKVFIKWIAYLQTKRGASFAPPEWQTLTSENYDLYRANPLEANTIKVRTETTETSMALTNFRKGVKRDVSAYIDFKEDKFWESWKRDLFAKARSHHTQDVLDPTYTGGTSGEEKELFALQQEFMYSVFIQHVLTPEGKTIVKHHSDSGDAQKIFQQLLHKYEQSPEARLNAIELRAKLATFIYDET